MATSTASRSRSSTKSASGRKERYETLHELLILKLRSLYDIEQEIVKALPKMAKAASNKQLQDAFTQHLEETQNHVIRLEEAMERLDVPAKKEKVEAIRGLIKDGEWCIKNIKNPEARDASLIAAAQYVEHYEMAGYGAARTWAEEMGHDEIADILQETLDEEGEADKKLTALAEGGVNEKVPVGMEE